MVNKKDLNSPRVNSDKLRSYDYIGIIIPWKEYVASRIFLLFCSLTYAEINVLAIFS